MIIIGIDPGYDRCGFAAIERDATRHETLLHSECFETKKETPFNDRLHAVGERFKELTRSYGPDVCAIEKVYFTTNQKTAMQVAEVRGMLLYLTTHAQLTLAEYTPNEIKVAIAGDGRADKKQVIFMLPKLIGIKHTIKHDDEYDAIATALTASACLPQNPTAAR